jgi:hypothetical protein
MKVAFNYFVGFLASGGLACAPADVSTPDQEGGVFIPITSDFECYGNWTSITLAQGDDGGTSDDASCAHVADVPRVAYVNHTPPHGSTSFPVGTMIVKEIHTTATPSDWPIFAMVKRGGGFGPGTGCEGWEWFGLGLDATSCSVHVQWSGLQPPSSEVYASCGQCASCHSAAKDNDCVLAPEMSLSSW